VTTIERTGAAATAIVGPDGHRMALAYDGNGFLDAVTNPVGELIAMATDSSDLLQSMTDPRGGVYAFAYCQHPRWVDAQGSTRTMLEEACAVRRSHTPRS
jgi:YD repeat-containing protein